ncbi:NADH:flavin oxidoreductase/NADH oxidase [Enterovirga sp.]|jgi:2,4-dienoyl-CoA reductase-like NADH-dependent reductase (Old Yellow Enzyme family)|uniref:NADH:flavin oxidoreductase/NADH oxidase n=1 Tax=Enterovirga sp. TaxID=2026350 RepID=UPI002623307E|nr:NADH:flavin oxidoreductase/NADH oxidase [Enterovirga sp.]MDB5592985.1 Oxidoreductase [Enterovirga sp.]
MLFSALQMRGLELPNRIVVSPMGQYSAENGSASDWHLMHLGSLAVSGAGLLVFEATAVHPTARLSPGDLGLWSDENAAALERAVVFCRKFGSAKLALQLWHAGRKGSVSVAWERQQPIPKDKGGWTPSSASAIPYPGRHVPEALDEAGIRNTIQHHVDAAKRADAIGLDLIEVHGAHGYLIHNFLSPITNQRTDQYGGSLENRMRFGLDLFKAVREVWPERKPLGIRISTTDWVDGGWEVEDSVEFVRRLKDLGCDYVTASSGGTVPEQRLKVYPGYQVPHAEKIRRETGMCTMAVGLITEPRQAEEILVSGKADLVALGRGMLYNPRWPWHAAVELGEDFSYPKQYERSHPSMRSGDFLKPAR